MKKNRLVLRAPLTDAEGRPFARLPSANATCPCGSGRKFKRCHGRIRDLSRSEFIERKYAEKEEAK